MGSIGDCREAENENPAGRDFAVVPNMRECLVLYNPNNRMLTNDWDTHSSGETFPMIDPLLSDARNCNMFHEAVIRDDDMIFKNDDRIEICDLMSGQLKKRFDRPLLDETSVFVLEKGRVYVNDDKHIYEVTNTDQIVVVAESAVSIQDFCVIRHDEAEFRCALLAPQSKIHFVVRTNTNAFRDVMKYEIPGAFEICGHSRGNVLLRTMNPETQVSDAMLSLINEEAEEDFIALPEILWGAQILDDKVFTKHGNSVIVVDIENRETVRQTLSSLDPDCFLIKRCYC